MAPARRALRFNLLLAVALASCFWWAIPVAKAVTTPAIPSTKAPDNPVNISPQSGDATKGSTTLKPYLAIDIPTVRFSEIKSSTGEYSIPWLAEYLIGVFEYAIGIGAFLAGVMILVGGFIYLTSGDSGRTSQAKTMITDSLLGLAVILSAVVLLNTINPQTTIMEALKLPTVEPEMFEAMSLQTTTAATFDETPSRTANFPDGFPNCPITLTAPPSTTGDPRSNPRSIEFAQKIGPAITATSLPDRIAQVASAMVHCQPYFGSCGRTIGSTIALAGASSGTGCLDTPNGCWTQYEGRTIKTMPTSMRQQLWVIRCDRQCGPSMARFAANTPNCANGGAASRERARTIVSEWMAANPWKDLLLPGDFVSIYNGNSDCTGGHAQSFLGWQDRSAGMAYTLNGQAGRLPVIRVSCLDFACGTIITDAKRPR